MATSGLLVLRACGQPAVSACGSCGKALCMAHALGGTCPDCTATQGQWEDNDAAREAASRNDYYNTYGRGTPSEYGAASFFGTGQDRASRPNAANVTEDGYDPFET